MNYRRFQVNNRCASGLADSLRFIENTASYSKSFRLWPTPVVHVGAPSFGAIGAIIDNASNRAEGRRSYRIRRTALLGRLPSISEIIF
jgi:hypothetical protein